MPEEVETCPRSQGKGHGTDSPAERILEMGKWVTSCHGVAAFEQLLMRGLGSGECPWVGAVGDQGAEDWGHSNVFLVLA